MKSNFKTLLAAAALALSIPLAAPRAFAAPADNVPGDALAAVMVPDTAAAWEKFSKLPTYRAGMKLMDSPSVKNNLKYKEGQLERQKWAADLGFPLTGEELMKNVFSDAAFYASSFADLSKGAMVGVLSVRDAAKAQKIIDAFVMRKRTEAPSAPAAAAPGATPATSGAETSGIDKLTIGGAEVTRLSWTNAEPIAGTTISRPKTLLLAIANNKFYISGAEASLRAALEPAAGAPAPLKDLPAYQALAEAAGAAGADLTAWADNKDLMSLGGAMPMKLPTSAEPSQTVAAVKIEAMGLGAKTVSSSNAAATSTLIKPGQLKSLGAVAPTAIVASATRMFDPDKAVDSLEAILNMPGLSMPGAGGQTPLQKFEASTGVSVRNELVPALGSEVCFAVNNFQMSPQSFFPEVDLTISIALRDEAKARAVMSKVEKKIEADMANSPMGAMGGGAPGEGGGGVHFTDAIPGSHDFRTLKIGMGSFSPSYLFADGYVHIGISEDGLTRALERSAGSSPAMTGSPAFAEMTRRAGTQELYSFSTVNVDSLKNVAMFMIPMIGMRNPNIDQTFINEVLTQAAGSVVYAASAEYSDGGRDASQMFVQMREVPSGAPTGAAAPGPGM